jgi:hypothetical protein
MKLNTLVILTTPILFYFCYPQLIKSFNTPGPLDFNTYLTCMGLVLATTCYIFGKPNQTIFEKILKWSVLGLGIFGLLCIYFGW